ncbi:hypothetical protein [Gemmata sp. SH-PL17]|uniref:hypothetical protein n=1 Tax=Gemmata sp. SH-PL17 TaxID=1630693 RepID=UPI0009ED4B83|nr:hypothetical protein [Gemmata sp. SH-PL17]
MLVALSAEVYLMVRLALACWVLGFSNPVTAKAPVPKTVPPQPALIVVEDVTGATGTVDRRRLLRIGVKNGKLFPSEMVWEGNLRFFGHFGGHRLVDDRYFVTKFGGVIDLRDKKVIHDEDNGTLCAVDGTKVLFRVTSAQREAGLFSFDLATGKVVKEAGPLDGKFVLKGTVAPDGMAAIESGPGDELFLNQLGAERFSLGKGFRVDLSPFASVSASAPVTWINNGVVITQKGNGKLFTVDISGQATELVTAKDVPKEVVGAPYFFRDGSNRLIYVCGPTAHAIDPDKKTATKYEWRDLGHGFEASWTWVPKLGHKIRLNGKVIGEFNCSPHAAKTAPGCLALEAQPAEEGRGPPDRVAVWTTESDEWTVLKVRPNCVVGWMR